MDSQDHDLEGIVPSGPLWKYLSLAPDQQPPWQDRLSQLCIDGVAYCPNPRQFNDPFDCAPSILSPSTQAEIDEGEKYLFDRMVESLPHFTPEHIQNEMRKGISGLDPKTLLQKTREAFDETAKKMGVFCLSECIDSVLMWSHYASNHTGIALRFDCRVEPTEGLMPLMQVEYGEERPKVSYYKNPDAIRFADALTKKAQFWAYEQEWRRLVPGGAGKLLQFNPSAFTGVVFGANCSRESRLKVYGLLRNRNIEYTEVAPSDEKFIINLQPASTMLESS